MKRRNDICVGCVHFNAERKGWPCRKIVLELIVNVRTGKINTLNKGHVPRGCPRYMEQVVLRQARCKKKSP